MFIKMPYSIYHYITGALFLIQLFYWIVMAPTTKQTTYRQTRVSRMIYLMALAIAFALVYLPYFSFGILDLSLLPKNNLTGLIGVILCAAGIFFAIWARWKLGTNWSGEVTLKKSHELIKTGPYRIVRHPIYTGVLCAMFGVTIVDGEVRNFLALLILFIGFFHKMKKEEKLMMQKFPEQYTEYKKQVSMMIPFLNY